MDQLPVVRSTSRFLPDPNRVITKPFLPGEHAFPDGESRAAGIIRRILAMPISEVSSTLAATFDEFGKRHDDFTMILSRSFDNVAHQIENAHDLLPDQQLLIGAYFTHEYSIEAAALSNPSMVLAPDQAGLDEGDARFILSLRAIGEGHISSIEFRSGVVDSKGNIEIDEPGQHVVTGAKRAPVYDKLVFEAKLDELDALNEIAALCLDQLADHFVFEELEAAILELDNQGVDRTIAFQTIRIIHWLASSNYHSSFPSDSELSERVLFPLGPTESNGMEDARFVRFVDDDDSVTYYATYTAYDGSKILPQLIETQDFELFRMATLNGQAAQNKGIALFPRKVNGRYAALSRQDNENNYLMLSDNVRFWTEAEKIQIPRRPWELTQIGNSGSPLETEAGWLVITHGVGPMRRYTLGAILLDLDDPSKVIGHMDEPLLVPNEHERDGYVPNVVYSCGGIIHNGILVVPYGFSDMGAAMATVPIDALLAKLTS